MSAFFWTYATCQIIKDFEENRYKVNGLSAFVLSTSYFWTYDSCQIIKDFEENRYTVIGLLAFVLSIP